MEFCQRYQRLFQLFLFLSSILITRAQGPPLLSNCPTGPVNATAQPGDTSTVVSWDTPTAVSTVGGLVLDISEQHPNPGDSFDVPSTTTITYLFLDIVAGTIATCEFDIIVKAPDVLVISDCPEGPVEVMAQPGQATTAVSWTVPTAASASGLVLLISVTPNPGDSFDVPSTTPVSYVFLDIASSTTATCNFDIVVTAPVAGPPTISDCPSSPVRVTAQQGETSTAVTWTVPTAASQTGRFVLQIADPPSPGDRFSVPSTTSVSYQFLDFGSSLTASCDFEIIVEEPTTGFMLINCPAEPIEFEAPVGVQRLPVTYTEPEFVGGFTVLLITNPLRSGSLFNVPSVTNINYIFLDVVTGESMTCNFDIVVTVETTNQITISGCPPDISRSSFDGQPVTVSWQEPTAQIGGAPVSPSRTHFPGQSFGIGATNVVYTFADGGMTETCEFSITITFIGGPPTVRDCPNDITQSIPLGTSSVIVSWPEPSATSNTGGAITRTRTHFPGSRFSSGETTVRYTFRDESTGLTAECEFLVIIMFEDDTTPPDITCPSDISEEIPCGSSGMMVSFNLPTASDDSGTAFEISRTASPGDFFVLGVTTVTFTFSDAFGNTAECAFDVDVRTNDVTPPVARCTDDIEVTAPSGSGGRIVFFEEPTATDDSGPAILDFASMRPGDFFPLGKTVVTFSFRDACGNTVECSFCVTVTEEPQTDILNCPESDIVRTAPAGANLLAVSWDPPTTASPTVILIVPPSTPPGSLLGVPSVTTITYIFLDLLTSSTSECVFDIVVNEAQTSILDCPESDIVRTAPPGANSLAVTWDPPTTASSTVILIVPSSTLPGSLFGVPSVTTITYVFLDLLTSMTLECAFDVVVNPGGGGELTINNCPDDIRDPGTPGSFFVTIIWEEITAVSTTGATLEPTSQTRLPGFFNVNTLTEIVYTFVDPSTGATATCTFTVDTRPDVPEPPTVMGCPNDITRTAPCGSNQLEVTWTVPTAVTSTGAQAVTLQQSHAPGTPFGVPSVTNVEYLFVDLETSLMATCGFTITIVQGANIPPSQPSPCQPITQSTTGPSTRITFDAPVCNDPEDGFITATCSPSSGSTFFEGVTTAVCTCRDSCGDSSQCSFEVTVMRADMTPPVIDCPGDTSEEIPCGSSGTIVFFSTPTASDDSGAAFEIGRSASPGDFFVPGVTTVTFTFSDPFGNTAECAFDVVVRRIDVNPPVKSDAVDIEVTAPAGSEGRRVIFVEPTATGDSGPLMLLSASMRPGDFFPLGKTVVTYVFIDACGSTLECTFCVTVTEEAQAGILGCPESDIVRTAPTGANSLAVTWDPPTTASPTVILIIPPSTPPGSLFGVPSVTTITYVFLDLLNSMTLECVFDVVVDGVENNPPSSPVCPSVDPVTSFPGNFGQFVTFAIPVCSDVEDSILTSVCSRPSGSLFVVGVTTVTCTCTDSGGASSDCQFNVEVESENVNNPPSTPACPSVNPVTSFPGNFGQVVTFSAPPCSDQEDGVLTSVCVPLSGSLFSVGTTAVTCTCTDSEDDSSDCEFDVEVLPEDVNNPPSTPACPSVNPVTSFPGNFGQVVTFSAPTCSDQEDGFLTSVCVPPSAGSLFSVGTTTVSCTCTDSEDASSDCDFDVEVLPEDVNNPPSTPACPSVDPVTSFPGNFGQVVTFSAPPCSDQEDGVITSDCVPPSGSLFSVGTTAVTCTCTDSEGDSSDCEFDVEVLPEGGNNPPSTPACPSVNPVTSFPGNFGQFVTFDAPSCLDQEDGVLSSVCVPPSAGSLFIVGTTTVSCTCTDSEDASSDCEFDVEVLPDATNNDPTISPCPLLQPFTSISGGFGQFVNWQVPSCSDNEDGNFDSICNPAPNGLFQVGTAEVTCTCTDQEGATDGCVFDIIVRDDVPNNPPFPPECPSFPNPFTSSSDNTGRVVEWPTPPCFDIEDGSFNSVCVPASGTQFPIGTSTVTCTCTDLRGATSDCRFDIDVIRVEELACVNVPDPIVRTVNPDQAGDTVIFERPSCSENEIMISCSRQSPIFVEIDTTTTVLCTCSNGPETVMCTFPISVRSSGTDVEIQVMNCPSTAIVITPTTEMDNLGVFWSPPFAISSMGMVAPIIDQTHTPGNSFPIPSLTEVVYVFGISGVTAVCQFDVRVNQPARVEIVEPCPDDFMTVAEPGVTSISVTWMPPTAVNEANQVVPVSFQSHFPGANFPVPSTTTVNYVFSNRGVTDSCSFRVIIRSRVVPPTITNCPSDIEVTAPSGDSAIISWVAIEAITFAGQPAELASATHRSGDTFPVGTESVVLVFRNPGSETPTATCAFMVTILAPPPPPTLVSCPDDVSQRSTTGNPIPVTWAAPTAVTSAGEFAIIASQTHRSGDSFPVGETVVLIELLDPAPSGLRATCAFPVRILPPLRPPTILICPNDMTLTSPTGDGLSVNFATPTARTQSGQPANIVSQSHFPGTNFPVGETTVQYIFGDQDQPGASPATCSFCITIELVLPDPPNIVACPLPIILSSPSGGGTPVSWGEPIVLSDPNSGGPAILVSQTHAPGAVFPRGETTVVYIYADPVAPTVTSTCEFTVTVVGPPNLVTCPQDIASISPLGDRLVVNFDQPTAVTDSGAMADIQSQSPNPIVPFLVGITPVQYVFVDPESSLIVTCEFTVSVLGPPMVLGCLSDQVVTAIRDTVTVNWVPPTAVSSLDMPIQAIASHQPGTNFPSPSTTTITYTFTDPLSALTEECVFDIIVVQPPPPEVIACPSDIVRSGVAGPTNVVWGPPTAISDSGQSVPCSLVNDVPAPFMIPSTTTIVYLCTDSLGASATCVFEVILTIQRSPPRVTGCPEDIVLDGPPGAVSVPIVWIEPTSATSSGLPATIEASASPGQVFPIPSETLVTYTFIDPLLELENSDCSFSIVLTATPPDTPPTIVGCPASVQLGADNIDTISVSWTEPSAVSNIGGTVTATSTHQSGTNFPVPSRTKVTYTFTDSINERSSDCEFNVTVSGRDTIPPTIMDCPGRISINTPLNLPAISVTWVEPTATDRGQPITGVSNFQPGFAFPVDTPVIIEYTFTDEAGNSDTCSFRITIIRVDEEPPVISDCPEQISLTAVTGNTVMSITWSEPTATDNFGEVTVMASHQPGREFEVDTSTLITYTFIDGAGNDARCVFTISLTSAPDDPPEIEDCPENVALEAPPGSVTVSVAWIEPTATDLEGEVTVVASHRPNDLFRVGRTSTIIYTFMDKAGQTSVCLFTIQVTALPDTNPPEVSGCPMPVIFERVPTGSLMVLIDWDEPTATDAESMVRNIQTHTPPITGEVGDRIEVSYTFTDGPNTATCEFTIFVLPADNTPPEFQNCPSDITKVALQTDVDMSMVSWNEPVATDSISDPVTITVSRSPGTQFPIGTPVTVTYTAIDSAAVPNRAECEFVVEVLPFDMVAPLILGCPGEITRPVAPELMDVEVFWDIPFTLDTTARSESTHEPGDLFPVGETTPVSYTFIDMAGNTATCDFGVFVVADGAAPDLEIPCPAEDITMPFDAGVTEVRITDLWPTPVAVDRFSNVSTEITVTPNFDRFFDPGVLPVDGVTRIIQYTFTDDFQNARNCFFAVTLEETLPPCPAPVFQNCPSEVFELTGRPNVEIPRVWPEVVATADCPLEITSVPENTVTFTLAESANIQVEITAVSEDGLFATCNFPVIITIDATSPMVECPGDISETVPSMMDQLEINWGVDASDDSGMVTLDREGPSPGDMFGPGQSTVTYTATDPAGNTATCSFTIEVEVEPISTDPPRETPTVVNCTSDTLDVYTNSPLPQMVEFPAAGATDADGNPLTGVLDTANMFVPRLDPYNVSFTFTDAFGLTSVCTYQLQFIVDTEPPVIVGCRLAETMLFGTIFPDRETATITFPVLMATDSLDPNEIIGVMEPPGNEFGLGVTNVTVTFSDQAGNSDQCVFIVSVNMDPCDPNPCGALELCSFDEALTCTPTSCVDYFCEAPSVCSTERDVVACSVSCNDVNCNQPGSICLEVAATGAALCTGADPCGAGGCEMGQSCQGELCIPDPLLIKCLPACGPNEVCEMGECVAAVARCEDYFCDERAECIEQDGGVQCVIRSCDDATCDQPGSMCLEVAATGAFCTGVNPCGVAGCPVGASCQAGRCIPDPQLSACPMQCPDGQVCDMGQCVDVDPCDPNPCTQLQTCNPDGTCSSIPLCATVSCVPPAICTELPPNSGNVRCSLSCSSPAVMDVCNSPPERQCIEVAGLTACVNGSTPSLEIYDCSPSCTSQQACQGFICVDDPVPLPMDQVCYPPCSEGQMCVDNVCTGGPVNTSPVLVCQDSESPDGVVRAGNLPTCTDVETPDNDLELDCSVDLGAGLAVGNTAVTCTCRDGDGATDTCTYTITVPVGPPPILSCQDSESNGMVGLGNLPSCTDAGNPNNQLTPMCNVTQGAVLPVGLTDVGCTCEDGNSERATCTYTITVTVVVTDPCVGVCSGMTPVCYRDMNSLPQCVADGCLVLPDPCNGTGCFPLSNAEVFCLSSGGRKKRADSGDVTNGDSPTVEFSMTTSLTILSVVGLFALLLSVTYHHRRCKETSQTTRPEV